MRNKQIRDMCPLTPEEEAERAAEIRRLNLRHKYQIPYEGRSLNGKNAHIVVSSYEIFENIRMFESFDYLLSYLHISGVYSGFWEYRMPQHKSSTPVNYMDDEIQTWIAVSKSKKQ